MIGRLPVVELSCERKAMTSGSDEVWEAVESLSIYAGEELALRLAVRNQGTVPVCDLDLRWEAGEDGEAQRGRTSAFSCSGSRVTFRVPRQLRAYPVRSGLTNIEHSNKYRIRSQK